MKKILALTLCILNMSLAEKTAFGSDSYETGFTGYLYNLKNKPDGKKTKVRDTSSFYKAFDKLAKIKFADEALFKYQTADESNDLKFLNIKKTDADQAPTEFGSSYIDPKQIIMVYKGVLEEAPKKRIRFAGLFDDVISVLVNGKMVFYAAYHKSKIKYKTIESNRRKKHGHTQFGFGEYVTLKKGDEITLVLAEVPGGLIGGCLMVQEEGFEYKKDSYEDPVLHPFVCADLSPQERKSLSKKFETRDIPKFSFEK